MALAVGTEAPDFTLPTHLDEELTLSGMRGKKLIVFFYPRDFTPG